MGNEFENAMGEVLNDLANDSTSESTINSDSEGTAELETSTLPETDTNSEGTAELEQQNDGDVVDDETDNSTELEDLESFEEAPSTDAQIEKDAQAFARMRTQLKQTNQDLNTAKSIIEFFDVRAKQMGLSGIQEMMQKTVDAEMAKQAEKEGIPVDVLKRISDLETRVQQQDLEREHLVRSQKEQAVNHVFNDFVQSHSLGQKAINQLANDLVADGFNFDALMNMPSSAVTKILNSYLPNETLKQEALVKKEQIKKEVPPTGSTSSTVDTNSAIDKIAKMWSQGLQGY